MLDCAGTTGLAPPRPSTVISTQNIDSSNLSGSSVSALRTSPDTLSTERRHDLGGSIDLSPCSFLQEDQNITSHPGSEFLHDRPPSPFAPILTLSYDDPHQTALHPIVPGREYNSSNDLFSRRPIPSHVIPCDGNRSITRKQQIIDDLQTQIEGTLSAGLYDRNNRPTPFDPEYRYGAREVSFLCRHSSPG